MGMPSLKVFLAFLINCIWAIASTEPEYIRYVVREPLGPESNGGIELETMMNMDFAEKDVKLKLDWEYESSTVIKGRDLLTAWSTDHQILGSVPTLFPTPFRLCSGSGPVWIDFGPWIPVQRYKEH